AHPALFEVQAQEITTARVERDYQTDHNGARHLTYQQQVRGVDLFECEVRANLTRDGELINICSTMLVRPAEGFDAPAIAFEAGAAVRIAAANLGVRLDEAPKSRDMPKGA